MVDMVNVSELKIKITKLIHDKKIKTAEND